MSIQVFINHLSKLTPLSERCVKAVSAVTSVENYRARQIILAAGQPDTRIWFVAKGLVRSYYFDDAGKEHTAAFHSEFDAVFSLEGFWKRPANYYIEALEATTLCSITYEALRTELMPFPEMRTLQAIYMIKWLTRQQFERMLLLAPGDDRYHQARAAQPWLFARVPLRLIATYLNMTRENLSRLMSKDL